MRVFFKSWAEIDAFVRGLHEVICPRCGGRGVMRPHGWRWRYDRQGQAHARGRRICCLRRRGGCGKTPCLRPGSVLPRRYFEADDLDRFIAELMHARSIKAAWERCGIRMSLDTGYRLYRRLWLCLPILRTQLCSRAPPPEGRGLESALQQAFEHLCSAFGDDGMVSTYQRVLQKDFLAVI